MSGDAAPWPWKVLGLAAAESDRKQIKRAYAGRLKQIDPATDPAGFQALREAYECALVEAQYVAVEHVPPVASVPAESDIPTPLPDIPSEPFGIPLPEAEVFVEPEPVEPDEDALALAALHDEVQDLLDSDTFHNARWAAVLRDPLLDVFAFANEIEHRIFGGVYTRIAYEDDGVQKLPAFVTPRWVELIDQRFGWTGDLPLFQRKFGWQGGQILPLLSQKLHQSGSRLPETYTPRATPLTRWPWLQRAIIMCAGYTVFRAVILVVLP